MSEPSLNLIRTLEVENSRLLIKYGLDGNNVVRTTKAELVPYPAWSVGDGEIVFNVNNTLNWHERDFRAENYRQLAVMIYSPRLRGRFSQAIGEDLLLTFSHLEAGRCCSYLAAQEFYHRPSDPKNFSLYWQINSVLEGLTHLYLPKVDGPFKPGEDLLALAKEYMVPWRAEDREHNRAKIQLIRQIHDLLPDEPSRKGPVVFHGYSTGDVIQQRAYEAAMDRFDKFV